MAIRSLDEQTTASDNVSVAEHRRLARSNIPLQHPKADLVLVLLPGRKQIHYRGKSYIARYGGGNFSS